MLVMITLQWGYQVLLHSVIRMQIACCLHLNLHATKDVNMHVLLL